VETRDETDGQPAAHAVGENGFIRASPNQRARDCAFHLQTLHCPIPRWSGQSLARSVLGALRSQPPRPTRKGLRVPLWSQGFIEQKQDLGIAGAQNCGMDSALPPFRDGMISSILASRLAHCDRLPLAAFVFKSLPTPDPRRRRDHAPYPMNAVQPFQRS